MGDMDYYKIADKNPPLVPLLKRGKTPKAAGGFSSLSYGFFKRKM
jgi:hypothetical protein